jgi:hypothetical protein
MICGQTALISVENEYTAAAAWSAYLSQCANDSRLKTI